MKKKLLLCSSLIFATIFFFTDAYAKEEIDIFSKNAVVIDSYDKNIIYEKNKDEQVYPASITKVLTAIIIEEEMEDGELITASKEATLQEPSNNQFLLEEGEQITKEDAIKLMMMISSNDVAYAAAETIAGSIEDFSKKMNQKASELGAKNSNFINPSGLPDPDHKTTAYDMSLIGLELLNHPEIMEASRLKEFTLKTNKREVEITRTNSIFTENEKAIAGKTGWTISSGNTLLEVLQDKNTTVVAVTMGAGGSDLAYADMNTLSEYAFEKTETIVPFKKDDLVTSIEVNDEEIELFAKEDIRITTKGRKNIENRIVLLEKEEYQPGETIARLEILNNKNIEKTYDLYTDQSIKISEEEKDEEISITKQIKNNEKVPKVLMVLITVPIGMFLLLSGVSSVVKKIKHMYN